MLQPAATSSQSSLSLAVAAQGGTAESHEIPEGFAALLALGMPSGDEADANPKALLLAAADALRQNGKAGGNAGGKVLPAILPESEAVAAFDNPASPAEESKDRPLQADAPADPILAMLAVTLPLPGVSAAAPQAGTGTSPVDAGQRGAAMQLPQADQAALTAKPVQTNGSAIPAEMATALGQGPHTDARPSAAMANAAAPIMLATADSSQGKQATQSPILPLPGTPAAPQAQHAATAPVTGKVAMAGLPPSEQSDRGSADVTPTRSLSPSSDLAIGDIAKPIAAAELQPVLAMREAQTMAQGAAGAPPSSPAASSQQGRHDFAALVDRLVEARDAAVPQAVRAAIHHADFGQVSLNFQANDTRLSVSMTSADPDFTPAVQAAAAMQANNSADSNPNGHRQDSQGQQQNSAGSASGQSQAQSQGSARGGERERTDTSRQTGNNEAARTRDERRADGRGGIYA